MQSFSCLTGVAAALPLVNIDTDKILAGQFLKTTSRAGLGVHLFHAMRYAADGSDRSDFVLNRDPWRGASILIAGPNFGCGSSREHAPWALLDFGIRCIIAPSFADIFYNNCFKNGILPVLLGAEAMQILIAAAETAGSAAMTVDLPAQTVTLASGAVFHFDVDPDRKRGLLEGRDEIGQSLMAIDAIRVWEAATGDRWGRDIVASDLVDQDLR
ncbi:3-isopropylmalate dehydratase small subunit [Brevundimonas sp. SH203]|uniref:3-isopropylmalate dehydratase small subunit n=1 Tax=Brevundimonas sp. SH203 TaxID=345167 RepID=UPI0009CCCA9E|nr:3-isopropylmalate dehydratase small subunit [Brevundimonas sp. SH203]GAW40287.1 3-isopropylmalate dehydratase small subunit [Brevundimonas sp. SH203]